MEKIIIGLYSWEQIIIFILGIIIVSMVVYMIGFASGVNETRKTLKESINLKHL